MLRQSIRYVSVFCALFVLINFGCDSEKTSTGVELVADIDDLRVELACLGTGSSSVNCETADNDESRTIVSGKKGVTYDVTIRIRGLVEQKTYSGYSNEDGMWIEEGTPDGSTFNIFKLEISSPAQTYFLNSGSSYIDQCFLLDIQKTLVMDDRARVTLFADAGGDGLSTKNRDQNGNPIVVPNVPPAPNPFDGQFLQMDIISINVHE